MFLLHVIFSLECSFLDSCGSGTLRCGGFMLVFPVWSPLECFHVSMGDILSAFCDIKMYHTPIQTVSYDTLKYRMPT